MKYPSLTELRVSRETVDVFKGYNHNLRINDGEFYHMKNMSSSEYPVLSPRKKRGLYSSPENPQGLVSKDTLCYVDGSFFVINEFRVDLELSTEPESCPKDLISMGAYVIVMPDKKYINTANLSDCGSIDASITTEGTVTFELCKLDGEKYDGMTVGASEPTDPQNTDLWLDTSSIPNVLKQYSKMNAMWVSIATTYIKISATGIGKPFAVNDGVTISGVENESLSDLNSTTIVWGKGDDYIIVTGILNYTSSQESPITIARQMPTLDLVIESGNRLWGCRYGVAVNGEVVNEIYASKLGDFKNWNCFAGISTDSYAATVGTDGQFTGAITHLGYPLFFKENFVHKVYGNYPANYQIQTTACRGVQKGCARSLAIVNEVLYYKSRSAVCAYDGSLPVEISSALGEEVYNDAVAGAIGNKYYISMRDNTGKPHLFVYDTTKGMWHREDETAVYDFCNCRGELYFIDALDRKIKTVVAGRHEAETTNVEWMVETGIIGMSLPDKKYISKLDVRISLDIDARVHFYIQYDSSGAWERVFTMTGTTLCSFAVPVRPKRCDHLRLRIEGEGEAKIYSICKSIEKGSDM